MNLKLNVYRYIYIYIYIYIFIFREREGGRDARVVLFTRGHVQRTLMVESNIETPEIKAKISTPRTQNVKETPLQ